MSDTQIAVEQPKMPSADLINFRFDQIDGQLREASGKLDRLAGNFVTKEEALSKRAEYDKKMLEYDKKFETVDDLKTRSDQQDGAIVLLKVMVTALTLVAAIIGGLWWVKG